MPTILRMTKLNLLVEIETLKKNDRINIAPLIVMVKWPLSRIGVIESIPMSGERGM
jgi:hypothetical protein